MPLTIEQQTKLKQWLFHELLQLPVCPVCTHHDWFDGDLVGALAVDWNDGVATLTKRVATLVRLECSTCGYTIFFNAKKIGVIG